MTPARASPQAPAYTSDCGPQARGFCSTSLLSVGPRSVDFNIVAMLTTHLFPYLYFSSQLRHATSPVTHTDIVAVPVTLLLIHHHILQNLAWLLPPLYAHRQRLGLTLDSFTWLTYRLPRSVLALCDPQMSFSNLCLIRSPCHPAGSSLRHPPCVQGSNRAA